MLFNSYPFIFIFMPLMLAAFFAAARVDRRLALLALLIGSLVFYSGWSSLLWLIIGSFTFNYCAARLILWSRIRSATRTSKLILASAITGDLLLLGYYKYANFIVANIAAIVHVPLANPGIVLPIGISFFTFTQIAFLVDVARGVASEPKFLNFGLFVTYFPHLLAGPIIHHKEIMPQFDKAGTYRPQLDNFAIGLTIFAIGLFKKVGLADSYIPSVSALFAGDHTPLFFESWRGTLSYTLQIYFDFSGYSDMAIGMSRLFGIDLPLNFNSPYKSLNIIEFWRRWHMTLSRFLRDYLYFSLGGNRKGPTRRFLNLYITMLLGGLWHGAGWTFVVWGALHGVYLIINHAWRSLKIPQRDSRLSRTLSWVITFLAVVVAWVFFRARNIPTALLILKGLAGLNNTGGWHNVVAEPIGLPTFAAIAVGLAVALFCPNTQEVMQQFHPGLAAGPGEIPTYRGVLAIRRLNVAWGLATGVLIFLALSRMNHVTEFIYYQF